MTYSLIAFIQTQLDKLRKAVQSLTNRIVDLEKQATKARLAKKLGCNVSELDKKELECPSDKMGRVIGKGGAMMKQIEEKANVSLDVDPEKNLIVISGNPLSFPVAEAEISKIIQAAEESVDVPNHLILYLTTSRGNAIVNEIKEANPDVYMEVNRKSKTIPMRGQPGDIAKVKAALINLGVIEEQKELTAAEAQLVIGKKGANIDTITAQFKVAIEIEKKDDGSSLAIIAGPPEEVEAAMKKINGAIESNAETTQSIPCDRSVVQAFLTSGGFRIKELNKNINESTRAQNAGTVLLTFDKTTGNSANLLIKGKNAAMSTATAMAKEAIREIDTETVRIMCDIHAIPQIIGKGGENIKELKADKNVNIEVDKKTGEISITGLEKKEVSEVEAKVLGIISENKVVRISVDSSRAAELYKELVRSKKGNEIRNLCRLDVEEEKSIFLLRGSGENLQKGEAMVKEFLQTNHLDSVDVKDADVDLLLSGGRNSKIVSLAQELEVTLSVDKTTSTINVRGTEEKVKAAVKHINTYLYGGDGSVASKITVDKQAMGVVIGKGGKTRKALEEKYSDVSIHINRQGTAITIRGPEESANKCRNEILKLVATARITQSVPATEEQIKNLKKTNLIRRMLTHIPVQSTLKANAIEVRGVAPDVKDAVALINEHLTGVYESTLELGEPLFAKLKAANRDPSHFARMKETSGADDISVDDSKNVIVARGKKSSVKKAKLAVLDFLAFLVPGEFSRVKLPTAMHSTVGKTEILMDIAATTGASLTLDRDLNMIIVQSAEKDRGWEATKAVQAKINEAEKLVFVFEFAPSEAWIFPMLIGTKGSRITTIRMECPDCNIEVDKETRTVLVSGSSEEAVAMAKTCIEANLNKLRKENVWIDLPAEALPKFVGKGGAHIDSLRKKFGVEIETPRKDSKLRVTGDNEGKVGEAKAAIEEWIAEWSKPVEKKEVQIKAHHVSAIIGKGGATIQSLQEEIGCRIDLDREQLIVSFRGDPVKQQVALKRIQDIIAEIPAPVQKSNLQDETRGDSDSKPNKATSSEPKKKEDSSNKQELFDPEEQKDRTQEFPSLPVGLASGKKKRRKRNKKGAGFNSAATTPTKSIGASSGEESLSDDDNNVVSIDPAVVGGDQLFTSAMST